MNIALLLSVDAGLAREARQALEALPSAPTLLHFESAGELEAALSTVGDVEFVLASPASEAKSLSTRLPLIGVLEPGGKKPDGLPCLERPIGSVALQSLRDLLGPDHAVPTMAHARERALARFFSGIAHDVNNRLTTLTGYISMLPELLPEVEKDMIVDMETAADAAGDLVRRLQALKDTDRLPPHPIDLAAQLESLRDLCRRLVHPDTPLTQQWPASGLWIQGDPASLEFILVGGLSWFAGDDAPVSVTAGELEDGRVELAFASPSPLAFTREPAWKRDLPVFREVLDRLDAAWRIEDDALRFTFTAAPPPEETV